LTRFVIIGLDCAEPSLVFRDWISDLPNLKSLVEGGIYGNLRSTVPPITVPAWTSMMTSKDPGQLGFYGFRNRSDWSYDELYFANAKYVKAKEMADSLGMDVADIMGIKKGAGARRRKPARKAKIKYRNPQNPDETWTGRGMRPVWLREKLEQGAQLEDFKVE